MLGRGGWEGGGEPTFVTSYNGNGDTFNYLVNKARDYDQDGILFMGRVKKGDPDSSPVSTYTLGEIIQKNQYAKIEKILLEIGRAHV